MLRRVPAILVSRAVPAIPAWVRHLFRWAPRIDLRQRLRTHTLYNLRKTERRHVATSLSRQSQVQAP